jgi:hypothetical protein
MVVVSEKVKPESLDLVGAEAIFERSDTPAEVLGLTRGYGVKGHRGSP